ncbi:RNA chaperone Hfq [Paraburkholderia nemoris]|uniref:RNA chaperone Hfq n=1 Tax=Paraburkholderia nemoris TaxID=2793076 RepID=UPI0038B70EA5
MYSQNIDAVRREQAVEGQRMTRSEGTLHRKTIKRSQSSNARKPEPEGHEAFLKELKKSGARIRVAFLDDDVPLDGTVTHSDKYTITLRTQTINHGTRDVVFFKHAIKGFYPIDLRAKEPVESSDSTVH